MQHYVKYSAKGFTFLQLPLAIHIIVLGNAIRFMAQICFPSNWVDYPAYVPFLRFFTDCTA